MAARRIAMMLSAGVNIALAAMMLVVLFGGFSASNDLGAPSALTTTKSAAAVNPALRQFSGKLAALDRPDFCAWAEDDDMPSRGGRRDRGPKFEEKLLQVRRITKVVKGGKNMGFRALVAVGDKNGKVGLGCASAKEVMTAVEKASMEAQKTAITVPITKEFSLPHRLDIQWGAASVMMKPAPTGTGLVAGGAVRTIMELAGYKNARGKQLGTDNALNNAKAVMEAFKSMEIEKIKAAGLL
uniref:Small ribosomal subunit protein uS5c n=1 Tax=Lotharella oceanica TaxID=641309 RepID=A0A7S2TQ57_9EUKA|mmetsp:Transcript_22732/g.42688  ORF Transcript_22732/g.42688 Transcript_22732/m.42688 type:complete len:241 (+) Transcript_22732:41-763(+)